MTTPCFSYIDGDEKEKFWFVTVSSVDEDVDKLWNFETHTVYTF